MAQSQSMQSESPKDIAQLKAELLAIEEGLTQAVEESDKKAIRSFVAKRIEAQKELEAAQIKSDETLSELDKQRKLEAVEATYKAAKEKADNLKASITAAFNAVGNVLSSTVNELEGAMDTVVKTQKAMSYALTGTTSGRPVDALNDVIDTLNKNFGSQGLVDISNIYTKLGTLIESGVTFNSVQRAYLMTLSDELSMGFNVQNDNLTRLINIQRQDSTAYRMSIQKSLKDFLAQNYETSQYIKDGFESVSAALLEAQSTMSFDAGLELEATIQKWMGSLSSVGVSNDAVSGLANAIGKLASGDISDINSGFSKLLIMGATKAGTPIGQILTDGLNSTTADTLLSGTVEYIRSIAGNTNKVVKSELAKIFGLKVSDVQAASNLSDTSFITSGDVGTDTDWINSVASNYSNIISRLSTSASNLVWGSGATVGTNELLYTIYRGISAAGDIASALSKGLTTTVSPFGIGVELNTSDIIEAIGNAGKLAYAGIANAASSGTVLDSYNPGYMTIGGKSNSGLTIGLSDGFSQSSVVISNENYDDIAKQSVNQKKADEQDQVDDSQPEMKDVDQHIVDINNSLVTHKSIIKDSTDDILDSVNNNSDAIISLLRNIESNTRTDNSFTPNTVSVEATDTGISYLQDVTTLAAYNIQNIYYLLLDKLSSKTKPTTQSIQMSKETTEAFSNFSWRYSSNPVTSSK